MSLAPASFNQTDRLRELPRCLAMRRDFVGVVDALRSGAVATLDGIWGSSCALVVAELLRGREPTTGTPLVVVFPNASSIDDFCDDLALFCDITVDIFATRLTEPGSGVVQDEAEGDRLRVLKRLTAASVEHEGNAPPSAADDALPLIVTSIQALLQPVPARETLAANTRLFRVGQVLDLESMLAWLAHNGFHNTSAVELPYEFSMRGGILDIYAPDWIQPMRVELFGDEISSLRQFDVSTQRSSGSLNEVDITVSAPVSAAQDHFCSYLSDGSWFFMVEPEQIRAEGTQYLERLERPQDQHHVPGTLERISAFANVSASQLATSAWEANCRLPIESVERFSGDIEKVRDELDQFADAVEVHVVCQTGGEVERLREIFGETRLAISGKLSFAIGRLRAGFQLASERIVLISGNELFHRSDVRRLPSRRLGKRIDNFIDLREGDLVVHLTHGIGRYRGLKLLDEVDGSRLVEEHLEIEFYGGTRVYVPSSKIDLIQKYIGSARSRPSLARIGGKTWVRQKEAAQQAAVDLAADMLQLQATRASRPGIAFACNTHWQQEFDALFPYEETPDQWTALGDIRLDMERSRPMDRLLCGDVGFGKTELAMRAAFAAIDNGYQVAVLVPTTILAEQHYRTFQERMSEFPCQIARLSRFCSPLQQREIIEGLQSGTVDVVIGTHRLASKDVVFQNLGLIVIDEEQRFGVEVKERLKTLRTTVDVLTMTATPIPRTLHMSLVGVRDISNLATPPEDRLSVETRVTRFQPDLIRHAVLREMNRGGQIFFVHNRVGDIDALSTRLRQIVPEANLRIGHGQMPESQLEQVMVDFVNGEFDLLLATTIVESGLDIPNANTIFIDEADRYGLADMHQLRGRVGRYKHRAYCYLLIDPTKSITPNAARRLRAIEEFSEMGAGFAIAMRDLEIRGAGNILGTEQSGHIAAVGYELYCELLEAAARRLQHKPAKVQIDVTIDLPGEAYLSTDYVPDMRTKIDLYRRFTRVASDDELRQLAEELRDRFGSLPEPVERLIELQALRIEAAVWLIDSIRLEKPYLVYTYTDRRRAEQLVTSIGKKLRIVDDHSIYLTLSVPADDPDQVIAAAKSSLA